MRTSKNGFCRNNAENKPRYDLIPSFMLDRLAALFAEGAARFGENNWKLGIGKEDYTWFEASFCRHSMQYRGGAENEDHFARAIFNLIGMEHARLNRETPKETPTERSSQWGGMADALNNQE